MPKANKKFRPVLFSNGRWTVEPVTPRQTALCQHCHQSITGPYRVKYVARTYPYPTQSIFCAPCAAKVIKILLENQEREMLSFIASLTEAQSEQPVQKS